MRLLDPSQPYGGKTQVRWAEAWTRWIYSIPAGARHPQTERTGVAQARGNPVRCGSWPGRRPRPPLPPGTSWFRQGGSWSCPPMVFQH